MTLHLGPVSRALEEDLHAAVVRNDLIVWLDADGDYTQFVDRLIALRQAGALSYNVRAYRGSFLELMFALEGAADDVDKPKLVIHMPRFNEEQVRATPVLELYLAGTRYRKALKTLIAEAAAGLASAEAIDAHLRATPVTLERADEWLAALAVTTEVGLRGELKLHRLSAILDDLLSGQGIAARLSGGPDAVDAVWDHLQAVLGLPTSWREGERADEIALVAASWALALEYVHDLRRKPRDRELVGIPELPRPMIEAGCALAVHLRQRHRDFYEQAAGAAEDLLVVEVREAEARDLGKIDTFEFEERKIYQAALAGLGDRQWETVLEWAKERLEGVSFWIERRGPLRKSAWELVQKAAALGLALTAAGPGLSANSLEAAVDRYVRVGAPVDRAHRELEQAWQATNDPQLPEYDLLRARLRGLRELWHAWADNWARGFGGVCRANGFLPPPALQQRMFFEDVVRPSIQTTGATVLFLVDALRFEMAEDLRRALGDVAGTDVELRARLAELPTITAVGMSALAPAVEQGKLRPTLKDDNITGFIRGEYHVDGPESRRRAMGDVVGGQTCPGLSLAEVLARDSASLKRTAARARLIIVHVDEIDSAGEKGVGLVAFGPALQRIRAALRLLHEAGVHRFVLTADHGFLLLDDTLRGVLQHGRRTDPRRRHVLSTSAVDHVGEVRVPLSQLGYAGVDGLQLMMPETTGVFDTGKRSQTFVHGGNSLQERVIPVLTIRHKRPAGGDTLQYAIVAEVPKVQPEGNLYCIRGKVVVEAGGGALNFDSRADIELALQVVGNEDVQAEVSQVLGGATLRGGTLVARMGEEFDVFFRLSGPPDARVPVELYHPAGEAEVKPYVFERRFDVSALRAREPERPAPSEATPQPTAPLAPPSAASEAWLARLPEGPARDIFRHLANHGVVTEDQAVTMFGGARPLRRFNQRFEEFAALAPFVARTDQVGNVKRYIRVEDNR
ncbi:BREX-6 system phosphatase PglZ [Nannocystis pusilla]|uniref:BREX-6 system phosphatase PglZ n=1 Tax=Nannocystis pusilla TaxID=889268 RepID=A0A9X3F164_9BACT|nr:BREX-6 system phosphatase PglZ [Nannocystis pusilla]MCY1013410.1 BREX-6 system phosphatase PglZ [Nannocystis pusilla]